MANIVHEVWKILDNNPSIRREMRRGLINMSALAKYIIHRKGVDATLDAVISAIRRYKLDIHDDVFDNAYKILN